LRQYDEMVAKEKNKKTKSNYPDRIDHEPDVQRAMQMAQTVQKRMLDAMEEVWPKNFYTGYIASMCDIRVKQLLFLTDHTKQSERSW
jgi:hypothetical protein